MAMRQWLCGATFRRALFTAAAETRPAPSPMMAAGSSSSVPAPAPAPALCGRGDKRTKRGKRFKGSYGNARPKKEKMIERIKDKLEVPRSTPWPLPFKII